MMLDVTFNRRCRRMITTAFHSAYGTSPGVAIMLHHLIHQKRFRRHRATRSRILRGLERLETRTVFSTSYLVHDLVSDQPGVAPITDPNLVNAWGIAIGPVTMWVSSNEKDLSTIYTGDVTGSPFL